MPVYEKCKVFTCSYACNLHVIIDSEEQLFYKHLVKKECYFKKDSSPLVNLVCTNVFFYVNIFFCKARGINKTSCSCNLSFDKMSVARLCTLHFAKTKKWETYLGHWFLISLYAYYEHNLFFFLTSDMLNHTFCLSSSVVCQVVATPHWWGKKNSVQKILRF